MKALTQGMIILLLRQLVRLISKANIASRPEVVYPLDSNLLIAQLDEQSIEQIRFILLYITGDFVRADREYRIPGESPEVIECV